MPTPMGAAMPGGMGDSLLHRGPAWLILIFAENWHGRGMGIAQVGMGKCPNLENKHGPHAKFMGAALSFSCIFPKLAWAMLAVFFGGMGTMAWIP